MKLYVIRHADAEAARRPGRAGDAARQLTDRGRRQATSLGRLLQAMEVRADAIWTSPLLRARETADRLAVELSAPPITEINALGSPGNFSELRRQLRDTAPASLVLVGHQPFLGECLQYWLCGRAHPGMHLSKATVAALSGTGYGREELRLEYLVNPQLAELLSNMD